MAGWVKYAKGLHDKAEVRRMARALGVHRRILATHLIDVWTWFSEETEDGIADLGGSAEEARVELDDIAGLPGLCAAMESEGWLDVPRDGSLEVVEFDRYCVSAKRARKKERDRKRGYRKKANPASESVNCDLGDVPRVVPPLVPRDKPGTTRGTPLSLSLSLSSSPSESPEGGAGGRLRSPEVDAAWASWLRHLAEKQENPTASALSQHWHKLVHLPPDLACKFVEESIGLNRSSLSTRVLEICRQSLEKSSAASVEPQAQAATLVDQASLRGPYRGIRFRANLVRWAAHLLSKGKSPTPESLSTLAERLARAGPQYGARCLQAAVSNGWLSIPEDTLQEHVTLMRSSGGMDQSLNDEERELLRQDQESQVAASA